MRTARSCFKKSANYRNITSLDLRPRFSGFTLIKWPIASAASELIVLAPAPEQKRAFFWKNGRAGRLRPSGYFKRTARKIDRVVSQAFPQLEILPVCADYLEPFNLPSASRKPRAKLLLSGSTIGNFEPPAAMTFLQRVVDLCEDDAGFDWRRSAKDRRVLERAYNDNAGVTAQFNLNLLARANRELGANFDLRQWRHHAIYNPDEGRIEIYLISKIDQAVRIKHRQFHFHAGEKIITEYSYKHTRQVLSTSPTSRI